MSLGTRIRTLRKQHGFNQTELADRLGGSIPFLCDLEHDRKTAHVSAQYLLRMADLLGTSVDFLLGRTDDPTFTPVRATKARVG